MELDKSPEISRIVELYLRSKNLTLREYKEYINDEHKDCDELGLTLFTYRTGIKILVYLKGGYKWSTDYLAEPRNCDLWLMKTKFEKYMEIQQVNQVSSADVRNESEVPSGEVSSSDVVEKRRGRKRKVTAPPDELLLAKYGKGKSTKRPDTKKEKKKKAYDNTKKEMPKRKPSTRTASKNCKKIIKTIAKKGRKRRSSGGSTGSTSSTPTKYLPTTEEISDVEEGVLRENVSVV